MEESSEDLGDGRHLAEDAEHAAAAQKQNEPHRHTVNCEADEGERDDEEVEYAPAVGDEGAQPIGIDVEYELSCESQGEEKIELGEQGLVFVL